MGGTLTCPFFLRIGISERTAASRGISERRCLMVHGSLGAVRLAECGLPWCPDGAKEYSPGQRPISAKIRS